MAMPALGSTPKTKEGAVQLYDNWAPYQTVFLIWQSLSPRKSWVSLPNSLPNLAESLTKQVNHPKKGVNEAHPSLICSGASHTQPSLQPCGGQATGYIRLRAQFRRCCTCCWLYQTTRRVAMPL